MDDEGGDWFTDAADEEPPPAAAPADAQPAGEAGAAPAEGAEGAPAEGEAGEEAAAEEEDEYLDPDKLLLFKHWIRPKFLPYKYLYDYRHNYYNDVIDYLDKRQKGLQRDIPVAQTWAERVLRTYNSKINKVEKFKREVEDTKLVTKTRLSGLFHIYHSKAVITRRYFSSVA